ncbi:MULTISPECIES: hypothetical protein [Marinobacter]|jgi:hypothetical protein|uniref:hypothetical protein n=1 Tax=Marinobacter TaxID=2742 RepID=UPI000948CA36|nr:MULTISPECIES: hypothetical protein [Marinobacter]MCZ4283948.1 hypothetical protein [Marinobacter salarius]MDM8180220.1 hypothetical protein [Marinobacter salarius]VVT22532.1 Topoisomerase IV [Marinobacter salarius]VXB70746.1 Topoisomerase IV [Marinobacter salarius]
MYSVYRSTARFTPRFAFSALALTATLSFPTMADDSQRIDQLEQRLDSMQKQMTESSLEKVRLNGFFSTGYTRANNDAGYDEATEQSDLETLSLFGLQSTFSLSRNTDAVLQLVSRGSEDWDTELEWGYLRQQFSNGSELRAGKMRLPLFMESETLEIGYGQPWARPPEAVYDPVPVRSYLGADAAYTINLSGSSIQTRAFAGHLDDDAASLGQTVNVELRNITGLTANWTNYLWTFRGVYAHAEATIGGTPPLGDEEKTEFMGLGLSYDDGSWLLMSELTRVEVDGFYQDTDSAYITLGYRVKEVTPYVTASWVESQDNYERDGTPLEVLDVRRQAYSLGFRWDMTTSVAMKVDWTHARGFGKTTGGLIGNQLDALAGNPGGRFDSTDVYTVRLDAAF